MSETKETKKAEKAPDMEELVSFTAPIDPTGMSHDILLGVNGETIRVKRGETVQIKRKFLEVWEHSLEQQNAAYAAMAAAEKGGQAPILEM